MLFGDAVYLGKHNADDSQFGAASKKQRWGADPGEDAEPQELLAWELEQERWTDKSDAAILEDPQWQRVGIKRGASQSECSDDDRMMNFSGRQSPVATSRSMTSSVGCLSPGSYSQGHSFLEDTRLSQSPSSPNPSVYSYQNSAARVSSPSPPPNGRAPSPNPSVYSYHSSAARIRSPSPPPTERAPSPNPSVHSYHSSAARVRSPSPPTIVRPNSSMLSRHSEHEMHHVYHSTDNEGNEHMQLRLTDSYHREPPGDRFGVEEEAPERSKTLSPLPIVWRSSTISSLHQKVTQSPKQQLVSEPPAQNERLSTRSYEQGYSQNVAQVPSWSAFSRNTDADELEAEYARLESGRKRSFSYQPGEERDEQNAINREPFHQEGYGLEELEEEYQRLEIRNQTVASVEENPSKEIIHLEDQASMEDAEIPGNETVRSGFGVADLEAEFEEAVRRKEVLMRTCSMDSNEADDILAEPVKKQEPKRGSPLPQVFPRKSRLREKMEKFERGNIDADSGPDVSRFPRLQQIRQRRRERLKALMSIRQERAEIWNTLEANWEQMENSMARRLASDHLSSKSAISVIPQIRPQEKEIAVKPDPTELPKDEDDSLRLSASEPSMIDDQVNKSDEQSAKEQHIAAGIDGGSPTAQKSQEEDCGDIIELLSKMNANVKNRSTGYSESTREPSDTPLLPELSLPTPPLPTKYLPTNEKIPASTAFLLEDFANVTIGADDDEDEDDNDTGSSEAINQTYDPEKQKQKEDPPTFGAFLTQSMSDVGSKVVGILQAVRSREERHVGFTFQRTETVETYQTTEEAQEDDDDTSNGLTLDTAGFDVDEEEPEPEPPGCVNPLKNCVGIKQRRIVVDDAPGPGCINPLVHFGFDRVAQICSPMRTSFADSARRAEKAEGPSHIDPLPSPSYSEDGTDFDVQGYVFDHNRNHGGTKIARPLYGQRTQSSDKDAQGRSGPPMRIFTTPKKSKRSKKIKHHKSKGNGTPSNGTFFTLVDDLLINNILNIVDEKVVDNMAHTFGFD